MKIGILQCDSVIVEYQSEFGDYPDMFIRLFQLIDPSLEFEIYHVLQGIYPVHNNECDAYITTGSKDSVYDSLPWLTTFKDFIRHLYAKNEKLVGICFGHQLIADIFGGETTQSHKGWGVGVSQSTILKHKPWMKPSIDTLNLVVSHQDQVNKLPPNAILLASNEFCPNFMYQMDQSILCMQGHPEFSKEYSQTMMKHRQAKIGEKTFEAAQQSLQQKVHDKIAMEWILRFMALGKR